MTTSKNAFWQFFGQGLGKISSFLFYLLLPLFIGLDEYGKLSFALAISFLVVQPLVELGLDMVVVKWVSRERMDVVEKAFVLKSLASFIALLLLVTVSFCVKADRVLLLVLFPYFVLLSFQNIVFSFFRGREKMKTEGIITLIQKACILPLLFVFIFFGLKKALLGPLTLLFSALFGFTLLLYFSRHQLREIHSKSKEKEALTYKNILKEGIQLGGTTLLCLIYFRIDSVMLGIMQGNVAVGVYNVAYKLMEGFVFTPSIIMIVSFPKLVQRNRFKEMFGKIFIVLGILGAGFSFALYISSSVLIRMVYGPNFLETIGVLHILSLVIFPIFVGHLTTQSLIALDLSKLFFIVATTSALVNILLNCCLIPPYGAIGAAWATLATEFMVTLFCGYFVIKKEPHLLSGSFLMSSLKDIVVTIRRNVCSQ